jgi:hypothetical protein
MHLVLKVIKRFYKSFITSGGVCFLYSLGVEKGNKLPTNTIKGNEFLTCTNTYLDNGFIFLKSIPKFLFDLTHLNFGFLTTAYYSFVIVMSIVFVYFLVTVYTFMINKIDSTFLKEYVLPENIKDLLSLKNKAKIFKRLGIKNIQELKDFVMDVEMLEIPVIVSKSRVRVKRIKLEKIFDGK